MSPTIPRLLEAAVLSDTGPCRAINEDRAAAFAELGLGIVADGQGGAGGALAATIGVNAVEEGVYARRRELEEASRGPWYRHPLGAAVQAAHARVRQLQRERRLDRSACATVTAAIGVDRGVLVAHAGDSRAHVLRRGRLRQLTRDHTTMLHPADADDAPPGFRALGQSLGHDDGPLEVDYHVEPVEPGDLWLLCTDGLTGQVSAGDIAAILGRATDLAAAARDLIAAANQRGGVDNVSVVLGRWG